MRIAASNERLCNIAEGTRATAEAEGDAISLEPLTPPQQTTIKPTEDPVSQARRHVAEAEARIERQEALVAGLSHSGEHIFLAEQAIEILLTLKQTHRLARDHLALETKK